MYDVRLRWHSCVCVCADSRERLSWCCLRVVQVQQAVELWAMPHTIDYFRQIFEERLKKSAFGIFFCANRKEPSVVVALTFLWRPETRVESHMWAHYTEQFQSLIRHVKIQLAFPLEINCTSVCLLQRIRGKSLRCKAAVYRIIRAYDESLKTNIS